MLGWQMLSRACCARCGGGQQCQGTSDACGCGPGARLHDGQTTKNERGRVLREGTPWCGCCGCPSLADAAECTAGGGRTRQIPFRYPRAGTGWRAGPDAQVIVLGAWGAV